MVAERDRVGQVLELEGVLAQPGDRGDSRQRADRDNQLLERDVDDAGLGPHAGDSIVGIELLDGSDDQVGVRAHHPQRNHDAPRLDGAGRCLGQQRRVEHEVGRVDDRRAGLAEALRDVAAGKPAADDEHAAASGTA